MQRYLIKKLNTEKNKFLKYFGAKFFSEDKERPTHREFRLEDRPTDRPTDRQDNL